MKQLVALKLLLIYPQTKQKNGFFSANEHFLTLPSGKPAMS